MLPTICQLSRVEHYIKRMYQHLNHQQKIDAWYQTSLQHRRRPRKQKTSSVSTSNFDTMTSLTTHHTIHNNEAAETTTNGGNVNTTKTDTNVSSACMTTTVRISEKETDTRNQQDQHKHHQLSSMTSTHSYSSGLFNLSTGAPVARLTSGSRLSSDISPMANSSMLRPFIYFRLDPSWFSVWIREHFFLEQLDEQNKHKWTHSFYNKGLASLRDTVPGVRYGFVHKYTAALTDHAGQVYVNERASDVSRTFFDIDAKGERISVAEICKIVRWIQWVVDGYMNIKRQWKSKTIQKRIGTVIIMATKQNRLYAKEKELAKQGSSWTAAIFKCGFHVIFPFVYTTEAQRKDLCTQVSSVLNENVPPTNFIENWSTMIDPKAVNSLRMLGSRRITTCPNGCKPSPSRRTKQKQASRGVLRREVNMDTDITIADTSLPILYNHEESLIYSDTNPSSRTTTTTTTTTATKSTFAATYTTDCIYDANRYVPTTEIMAKTCDSNDGHSDTSMNLTLPRSESSQSSSPPPPPISPCTSSNSSQDSTTGKDGQPLCTYCHGRGECCEDRSYVPLCVLDGDGHQDVQFEISLLDLRQAVDWTMIRAPSLFYDPTDGLIKPRSDVDRSVVMDQLYGLFRSTSQPNVAQKDDIPEDELKRWATDSPMWNTEINLSEAFHFNVSMQKMSNTDLYRLYSMVRGPVLDPSSLFGDGDNHSFIIPQWFNYQGMTPSHLVGNGMENVIFKDNNPRRYPEAAIHQATVESANQQHSQGKRLGIYSASYTLEDNLQDYEDYRRLTKKLSASQDNTNGAEQLEDWDPRRMLLRDIIRKVHSAYSRIDIGYVWHTYITADGRSIFYCRGKDLGSRYCFIAERTHESNHVYFRIIVHSRGKQESLVEIEQRCYDKPKASKGQRKGCDSKNPKVFTLDKIPYDWILALCPPSRVRAKQRRRERWKEHVNEQQQQQQHEDQSNRVSGSTTQRSTMMTTTTTTTTTTNTGLFQVSSINTPEHSEKFPAPIMHRTSACTPNATVFPTTLNPQLQKEKQQKIKNRLGVLWQKFQQNYNMLFNKKSTNCANRKWTTTNASEKSLYEKSVQVIVTWWMYLDEHKSNLKHLHPGKRNESPDLFKKDIRTYFLTDSFLLDKVKLNTISKEIQESFKEYLVLVCFWFMTSRSYKEVIGAVDYKDKLKEHPCKILTPFKEAESVCLRNDGSAHKSTKQKKRSIDQRSVSPGKSRSLSNTKANTTKKHSSHCSGGVSPTTTSTKETTNVTTTDTTATTATSSPTRSQSITIRIPKQARTTRTMTKTTSTPTISMNGDRNTNFSLGSSANSHTETTTSMAIDANMNQLAFSPFVNENDSRDAGVPSIEHYGIDQTSSSADLQPSQTPPVAEHQYENMTVALRSVQDQE